MNTRDEAFERPVAANCGVYTPYKFKILLNPYIYNIYNT